MVGIFLGISAHKAVVWGLATVTFLLGLIAAITADSAMGFIAMAAGVALASLLAREKVVEKVRDYRAEQLEKQCKSLDAQLEEERKDHEQTRQQLRNERARKLPETSA